MKLSEAMMLGGTAFPMDSNTWDTCLLGVSVRALGATDNKFNKEASERWPWMDHLLISNPPEIYAKKHEFQGRDSFTSIVSELAGYVAEGEMTLEAAVDWVASVEPQEEQADGGPGPGVATLEVQAV